MQGSQRDHIHQVIELVDDRSGVPAAAVDPVIRESWSRCVHEHKLDPTRMQEAIILPQHRLREHRERIEEFISIARHGLEAVYQQVGSLGYCVLLADARGVTVDYLGDLRLDPDLRRTGLYLGSDWNEHLAGTCAIGTAIATGSALTVHQTDHFDATHIPLTCTAAPIYDPLGRLTAVLDISALTSPQAKSSQHLALQLVSLYAHRVESANFLRWFRSDWVLKLHPSPEFVDISPDCLVALDAAGRIVGHNRAAQRLLEAVHGSNVLGVAFEQLFELRFDDLGRYVRAAPGERKAVALRGGRTRLYLHAIPPPNRWAAPPAELRAGLPAALAALSGGDPALDRQLRCAARLAETDVNLLVTGETGSGKEYFARALHAASPRHGGPFVAVNCAAIPETLIESELFGHLPGAFSGAAPKGKRGLVQEADGGTLFLDEIGDMPLAMQARLLRVLAEREVLPVGATRAVKVDVRVLAATHADLRERVRGGQFREDLYYRLAGAHLTLPPLRERRDLPWLIDRFLAGAGGAARLGPDAVHRLHAYAWPGNLRELRNVLDFACAMAGPDAPIGVADLPDSVLAATAGAPEPVPSLPPAGEAPAGPASTGLSPEALLLLQYLRAARWNVSAVAHQMGIARMTVYRRMKRFGLQPPV